MNKETALQNEIIAELCAHGCVARNHTVGRFMTKYGAEVKIGTPGESDILGHRCADGKAFYIEVKLPGEYPRKDQYEFLEAMQRAGAIAGWCTSVEGALKIVGVI